MTTTPPSCTCGRIAIGLEVTEHRNWNPDCPEHGTASEWWNSAEQRTKRKEQRAHLADLQRQAREARQQQANAQLKQCGSTPDNPRCTVSMHAICEKHH